MTAQNSDSLRDLIRATLDFYARFDFRLEVDSATRVFQEEVAEVIEAAHEGTNKDHIAEEAADVMVTVIGLCAAAGVEPERIIQQVYAVIAKNDAKTHETHMVSNGKIRRRHPKPE